MEPLVVKSIVVEIRPPVFLSYTVIDPNTAMEDIPENYLNVTYQLEEQDGKTTLTVIQDGFERAADGEKRYQDTYNNGEGLNPIFVEIKN